MEGTIFIAAQIIYLLVAIAIFVFVIRHSNKWASTHQKYMIEEAKKGVMNRPEQFEGRFMFYVIKTGAIFAALVILLMIYSILFGPMSV